MRKYNWAELKTNFFLSEIINVSQYLRSLDINPNHGSNSKKIIGWTQEKEKFLEKAQIKAQEEIQKKLVKLYTPTEQELSDTYKAVMYIFRAKALSNSQKIKKMPDGTIIIPPDVSMSENKTIWEIIKTERGEPIRVTKDDFIPPSENNDDGIQFYIPDNQRECLE